MLANGETTLDNGTIASLVAQVDREAVGTAFEWASGLADNGPEGGIDLRNDNGIINVQLHAVIFNAREIVPHEERGCGSVEPVGPQAQPPDGRRLVVRHDREIAERSRDAACELTSG